MSVELLETAAATLGRLRERVVFLGGATISLWTTDPAARTPRVTYDVDVVAEVVTLAGYERSKVSFEKRGSQKIRTAASSVDGSTKRPSSLWMLFLQSHVSPASAADGCVRRPRPQSSIGFLLGPLFASFLPCIYWRRSLRRLRIGGNDDCIASRDFEDVILLIDSREQLLEEQRRSPDDVQAYIRPELNRLMRLPTFEYGVERALTGPAARGRVQQVTIPRLRQLVV
jgi:hypothetical protein